MEEQLISLKTAKLAKERGFKLNGLSPLAVDISQSLLNKWLRETHSLHASTILHISSLAYPKWKAEVLGVSASLNTDRVYSKLYDTYEEALESALVFALNHIK